MKDYPPLTRFIARVRLGYNEVHAIRSNTVVTSCGIQGPIAMRTHTHTHTDGEMVRSIKVADSFAMQHHHVKVLRWLARVLC